MFDVKFAENVTIESLNPQNFAMKNDYIDNLISTALLLIPKLCRVHDDLIITRGFISHAHMNANVVIGSHNDYLRQHEKGLALEVSWSNFDVEDATKISVMMLESFNEPILIVVNTKDKKIGMYRRYLTDSSELRQLNDNAYRTVKTFKVL